MLADRAAPPGSAAPLPRRPARATDRRTIVDLSITRASVRAEKGLAWARLGIGTLALVRLVVFWGGRDLAVPDVKYAVTCGALVAGIAWSVWVLGWVKPETQRLSQMMISVTLDATVVAVVLLAMILWPVPSYTGLLRAPDTGVLLLATAAPGLRLSRRVAVVGVLEIACVYGLLLASDLHLNGGRITYGRYEVAIWVILFLGAAVIALAMALGTRRLVFEGAEAAVNAERARQRFGVYVSEEVAAEALAADALEAGGHRQPVAVLFSDLRGFTNYAEHLDPERLVRELNAYLDAMVHVVREAGGVVDKFIGDAIMAVFGVPGSRPDDAARAIGAALAMNEALARHNLKRQAAGRPPLRHGIGVHFGPVVAGNIGNAERLQYTVIGDTVNLASRLESATKAQGVPVLVSAAAVEAARDAGAGLEDLEPLGPVTVPGREAPVEVFSLRSS